MALRGKVGRLLLALRRPEAFLRQYPRLAEQLAEAARAAAGPGRPGGGRGT